VKKKKKTLYIRKVRVRYDKKPKRAYFNSEVFDVTFIRYFTWKFLKNKRKNFTTFMHRYQYMSFDRIFNFFKKFGINHNYRVYKFTTLSKISKKLNKKYKLNKKITLMKKREKKYKSNKKLKWRFKNPIILKHKYLKKFEIKTKFKKIKATNVNMKKRMCLYFSYRHLMKLPVRGQRTRTNAKTRKDFHII